MPVYLAEDPLLELFAFLNRNSLDKLRFTSHRFNRIISSRFKNAPFRVFENVVIHCEKYRNKLDVNGIVAFIRRIFLKSLQIVKSEEENEPDFLCKIVWDNRSVTTSLSKIWNMVTKEHTYTRKLTLKIPARRNEVRQNPEIDMVERFWWYIDNLLLSKFYIGALSISGLNFADCQQDYPERELLLSQFRPALKNCSRITIENHLPHLMDLLDLMFDNNRKCRLVISWTSHSSHFGHHYSTYILFFSKLEQRFQSATSIVPFKFTFQFYGYLGQDIVDYVYRHSSLVNSEAAKVLNIEAVAERPSQITVRVEEK